MTVVLESTLGRIGHLVKRVPLPHVAAGAFLVTLLADGLGQASVFNFYLRMIRGDYEFDGLISYLLGSPAGVVLAKAVGATTPRSFFFLHLGLIVAVYVGMIWTVRRHRGETAAKAAALVWSAVALSTVLLDWVGQPDVFVWASGTALLFVQPGAALLWGVIGGFANALQTIVVVGVVAWVRRPGLRWVLYGAVGVVVGAGLVEGWQAVEGISPDANRVTYLFETGILTTMGRNLEFWQAFLWSMFAGAWVLVFRYRRLRWAAVGCLAVTVLTLDVTRVFNLLVWPAVLWTACQVEDDRMLGWLAVAAVFVPAIVVQNGGILT